MSTVMNKEKAKIYETILCSPGMTEKCKVVLLLSRQQVLVLGRLMEAGFLEKDSPFEDEIIRALPKESLEAFQAIHQELLEKTDLGDFYQRLKSL